MDHTIVHEKKRVKMRKELMVGKAQKNKSTHFLYNLEARTSDRPSFFRGAKPLNSPNSLNLFLYSSLPDISLVTVRNNVG